MGLFSILFKKTRTTIGSIQVDVTISESHIAKSEVTSNPVEDGSDISDHVRLNNLEYSIEGVITNTPSTFGLIDQADGIVTSFFGNTNRAIDAYNLIMDLRESRTPFDLITGLRQYENMILEEFVVDRQASTANAIFFKARMKQVDIVSTETISRNDANLATSVNKLGKNKKNLGTRSTDTIPNDEPLSETPSGVSNETLKSALASTVDFFRGLF